MRSCDHGKNLALQPNGIATLVGRFEGLATGLSNRMAEDSARCLSEETRMLVLGLKEIVLVCRFRHCCSAVTPIRQASRLGKVWCIRHRKGVCGGVFALKVSPCIPYGVTPHHLNFSITHHGCESNTTCSL